MEPSSSNSNNSQDGNNDQINDNELDDQISKIGITMNSTKLTSNSNSNSNSTNTFVPTSFSPINVNKMNRINHPGPVKLPPPINSNSTLINNNNLSPPIYNNSPSFSSTILNQQPFPPPLPSPVSPSAYSATSSFDGASGYTENSNSQSNSRNIRRFPMRNVMYPAKLGGGGAGGATSVTGESEPGVGTGGGGGDNVSARVDREGILYESSTSSSSSNTSSKMLARETFNGATILNEPFLMTKRFEHTVMADGGNWIVTGREGAITTCEEEPIHAPGAIQAFGVLIAFEQTDEETLLVHQVSENSGFLLGIPPAAMFHATSFTSFLDPEESDILFESLSYLDERDSDPENTETGPLNFQLSGKGIIGSSDSGARDQGRLEWTVHCALHRPDRIKAPKRAILELEMVDDMLHPLTTKIPSSDEPATAEEKGGMRSEGVTEPSEEDLRLSTVSLVKPLRALTRLKAAKGNGARVNETDVVGLLSQINEQLGKADDLDVFLKTTAGVFKELTDFDRIMVYQFDEAWNGRVVAEQVDWSKTKDLFRGLNFPASDIPAQARELYRINKVRLLYDRDQPTARLCCRTLEEVQNALNMSHCHLRAMSPIHIKYLANMGVRSSMSISITAFGDLWGLVALHTYGRHGQRVSFPVRQLCKLLGDSISRNIERLSYAKRLHARKLINTAPTIASPSGYIVAKAEDLLTLFDADYGVLSIGDEAKILGVLDNSQELLAVLEYLRVKCFTTLQASQDIRKDFPDMDYPQDFELIAGLLSVPLSSEGKDFIVFFRRGQLRDVHWAGNPYLNKQSNEFGEVSQRLEPRKSFKVWSETVVGKCRVWTEDQLETAGVLCLVYGKFIDVWRQKETALAANQLTNLLLANASHEVRTPLNAIINYLELALDGPVDGEVREHLSKSHAASRSLIHVINDLLDLTRTEKGNELFLQDPFDLPSTINEAISMHKAEAHRRGLTLEVIESPSGTPPTVLGDRGKIRQIVTNVVANAVKHTTQGGILIEWGELADVDVGDAEENRSDSIRIALSITDTGSGISDARLESIFREFEQVSTVGDDKQGTPARSTLGLGLAVVARIVRNLGGQLRVESKLAAGSKFTFVLPFRLPSTDPFGNQAVSNGRWISSSSTPIEHISRTASTGSVKSLGSSSARSEIDSLISAISTSHMDVGSMSAAITASRKAARRTERKAREKRILDASQRPPAPPGHGVSSPSRRASLPPLPTSPLFPPTPSIASQHSNPPTPDLINESLPATSSKASSSPAESRSVTPLPLPPSLTTLTSPLSNYSFTDKNLSIPPSTTGSSNKSSVNHLSPFDTPRCTTPLIDPPEYTTSTRTLNTSSPFESTNSSRPNSSNSIEPPRHVSEYKSVPKVDIKEEPLPSMRVLVVEDEPINRMIIEKRLRKDGHEVVTAEHGGDALRLLELDPNFDLVLMDLQMPILNGFDAAIGIRKLESLKLKSNFTRRHSTILNGRLPILAVSASLHERQKHTIADVGIDGWILKPVDFKRLTSLMRGAFDSKVRQEDVYRPGGWERGGWLEVPGLDGTRRYA